MATAKKAKSMRRKFAGRLDNKEPAELTFPDGTPRGHLAKLGRLISITTIDHTVTPDAESWLCSDIAGQLHIGSLDGAQVLKGKARDYGEIEQIDYEERKPHLKDYEMTHYYHKFGDEDGIRPRLRSDSEGGLIIEGGNYRIEREGVAN